MMSASLTGLLHFPRIVETLQRLQLIKNARKRGHLETKKPLT